MFRKLPPKNNGLSRHSDLVLVVAEREGSSPSLEEKGAVLPPL